MINYRSGPRPLTHALGQLSHDLAPATMLAEVQRVWPDVVGEAIAAEAQPTAERGGVVTVSCSASVWAQELDLMSPRIVERLNATLVDRAVQRLRCVAVGYHR
jgi:predicted nucleic acid-binding Zn ribbon protein